LNTSPAPTGATIALSPANRRFRTLAVALLVVAGVVNYFDRSALSVANPLIRRDLHLSLGQMGLLLSAFAWSYGAAQIPAGLLVDRFGARRVLGFGLVLWSIAQIGSAASVTLGQFSWARVGLGAGEAPMYTGGTRVIADWYDEEARAMPIAVFNSSASLGPAIAPAFLTALILAFGWRSAFALLGVLGLTVAIAWSLIYRTPAQRGVTGKATDVPPTASLARMRRLLRLRITWAMIAGFFGVIYMTWLFATWLPGYLEQQRHLSVTAAGLLTSIPLGAGFLGALGAGFIIQALIRRGRSPVNACRLPVMIAMAATAGFTLAGALASSVTVSLALLSAGVFAANLASSAGWALGAVIVAEEDVASLEAIQNVGGSLGGALAPAITGYLAQASGSFVPPLAVAAAIALITAGIYAIFIPRHSVTAPHQTAPPPPQDPPAY
jgi:MFS family permease